MGRHRRPYRSSRAAGRAVVSVAALGVGLVPAAGLAAAAPAVESADTADSTDSVGAGVDGTPCTDERVKACVDLSSNRTWLLDGDGEVVRGPVPNTHGAEGQETPTGDFVVQWKDADHRSGEYDGAAMPWSVFFDTHGRAFHQGTLSRDSAGCVRLREADAQAFYEHLNPNDRVQIVE